MEAEEVAQENGGNLLKRKLDDDGKLEDEGGDVVEKVARIDDDQTEEAVGITEYINNDNPGFRAVMKQRYSDFNVYEIDPSGSVVHLDDDSIPREGDEGGEVAAYEELSDRQKQLITEVQFTKVSFERIKESCRDPRLRYFGNED